MALTLNCLDLPFHRPFVTGLGALHDRKVILLSLEEDGIRAFGESAPWRAFGTESLDASLDALTAWIARYQNSRVDARAGSVPDPPDARRTPCAAFAVESLLLDMMARLDGLPLHSWLADTPAVRDGTPFRLAVNAVLGHAPPAETADNAERAARAGYRCLKLKVGATGDEELDLHRIAATRAAVGPGMLLRLDANGAWTAAVARRMLDACAAFDIDYVEQPLAPGDIDAWMALKEASPVPLALDESLRTLDDAHRLLEMEAASVYVLKPMALGGIIRTRMFALEAAARGKRVVFTSFLDSAIGRATAAHLAASLPEHPGPHGFGTGDLFAADTATDTVRDGFLHLGGPGIGIDADPMHRTK